MARSTDASHDPSATEPRHPADSHDLIRVHGARVNNLKDIFVDIFSRLGYPHVGPSFHYGFNSPERMCLRCEGLGEVSDIDLAQLFDDSKSLAEGAITIPGYKTDGWWTVGIFTQSGFLDPNKPIRNYTRVLRARPQLAEVELKRDAVGLPRGHGPPVAPN